MVSDRYTNWVFVAPNSLFLFFNIIFDGFNLLFCCIDVLKMNFMRPRSFSNFARNTKKFESTTRITVLSCSICCAFGNNSLTHRACTKSKLCS